MLHPPSGKYNYRGVCKLCRSAQGRGSPGLSLCVCRTNFANPAVKSSLTGEHAKRSRKVCQDDAWTLFLSGRSGGLWRRRRLRFRWLGLHTLEYRARTTSPRGVDRQCDGSDHKSHGRPRRGLGKRAGCAARTKRRLTALTAECRGNVAALPALEQNNDNNEEANQDVDGGDQINHRFRIFLTFSSVPVEPRRILRPYRQQYR